MFSVVRSFHVTYNNYRNCFRVKSFHYIFLLFEIFKAPTYQPFIKYFVQKQYRQREHSLYILWTCRGLYGEVMTESISHVVYSQCKNKSTGNDGHTLKFFAFFECPTCDLIKRMVLFNEKHMMIFSVPFPVQKFISPFWIPVFYTKFQSQMIVGLNIIYAQGMSTITIEFLDKDNLIRSKLVPHWTLS